MANLRTHYYSHGSSVFLRTSFFLGFGNLQCHSQHYMMASWLLTKVTNTFWWQLQCCKIIAGDSGGQKCLACHNPWDHEELDMIGWLNTNLLLEVLRSVWEMIWMYEEAAVKTKWALKGHYGMDRSDLTKWVKCKLGKIPRKCQIKQNVHFRDSENLKYKNSSKHWCSLPLLT